MRIRHPLNLIPLLLAVTAAFIWGLTTPGISDPPVSVPTDTATDVTFDRNGFPAMSHRPPMMSENRNSPSSPTTAPRDVSRGDPFGALPSAEDIDAWIAELDTVVLLEARVIDLTDTPDTPRDAPRDDPPAPPPTTPPDPIAVGPPAAGSVEEIICAWFEHNCDQAIAVARCESTLRPGAISPGGGNWGLFQINTVHRARVAAHGYGWDQVLDPWVNTEIAHAIWTEQGWGPWTCARNLGIR